MSIKRILIGYTIAPLAAAVIATLLPYPSPMLLFLPWMYLICLVIGVPSCAIIRALPVNSIIIYIIYGVALGMLVAPGIQAYYEYFSHGHIQPLVANLVLLIVRTSLAGGVGLGVFWYIVVRTPNKRLQSDAKKRRA